MDRFRTTLESVYAGSQTALPCMFEHLSGVGTTNVEEQSPASSGGKGRVAAATNPRKPIHPKPSLPPTKSSVGHSRKFP